MPLQPHLEPQSLAETTDSGTNGIFIFTPLKLTEAAETSEPKAEVGMKCPKILKKIFAVIIQKKIK